jgi:hypothetical protein
MVLPIKYHAAILAALLSGAAVESQAQEAVPAAARRAVRAVWTDAPPVFDGLLDEEQWRRVDPTNGFTATEPVEGEPLTETTDVRILFDRANLYIGVYCYDSEPGRLIVNDLQRDFDSNESDALGVAIDPFHDRRSSYSFFVNPGGARRDMQAFGDGRYTNLQWDGIWDVRTSIRPDGWTAEIVIPFKTLGLKASNAATMGINFKRRIRRKNEEGYWSPVPRRFTINYITNAGDLTGLGDVETGGNLRLKPFATMDLRRGDTPALGDSKAKVGLDAKYRVAEGLALDLTLNTDFSQVDVDRQEINLTRFGLFFPEKRDFFLENAGIFELGDVPNERSASRRSEESQLFYSRRIGLSSDGQPLPLVGGVRLSGRSRGWSLGVMDIYQDKDEDDFRPSANYAVARVRRDLFEAMDAGAIVTYRHGPGGDYNAAYGADFNTRLFQKWSINGFVADTQSADVTRVRAGFRPGDATHQAKISTNWEDGFFDGTVLFADIGEAFDPQLGFVARRGVRNWHTQAGIHPRPRGWPLIREINPHMNLKFFSDRQGTFLTRDTHYAVTVLFHAGGRSEVSTNPQFDRLVEPFQIRRGIVIPPGDYRWNEFRLTYSTDRSQILSGSYTLEKGGFYDGHRTSNAVSATLSVKPRFNVAASYDSNHVRLPGGSFRADLLGVQSTYSFSPRMVINGSVQFNRDTETTLTNVRFSFLHHPLSDFIIVYNENLSNDGRNAEWRALIVKFTQLLQF